jgi:nitrate reductase assembly molybdenum cofactor insertion protein NarJ
MGIAAYNRGSRSISRETREGADVVDARAEYMAIADENARLRARVAQLDVDLARARRCLAAERNGREALRQRLAAKESAYAFAVPTLCKRAFPDDRSEAGES